MRRDGIYTHTFLVEAPKSVLADGFFCFLLSHIRLRRKFWKRFTILLLFLSIYRLGTCKYSDVRGAICGIEEFWVQRIDEKG